MSPDLTHLLDPDPNALPDLPQPGALPQRLSVDAGGGMRVSQDDHSALVSSQPDFEQPQQQPSSVGFREFIDPLKKASFRTTLVGGNQLSVVLSYINSVYYSGGKWFHESFSIPAETINVGVVPQFFYLKLPVRFFGGASIVPQVNTPRQNFSSSPPVIVNGSPHTFTTIQQTGYIARNQSVTPASYYHLSEIAIDNDTLTASDDGTGGATGFWHFYIGTVTNAGFEQVNIGIRTLSQPMTFNIVSLNVS